MHALPSLKAICPFTCKLIHYYFLICLHGDYTIAIHWFILSLFHSPFVSTSNLVIDVHIKKNLCTKLHGSSTVVTASSLGIIFTYMVHQSWFHIEIKQSHNPPAIKNSTSLIHIKIGYKYTFHPHTYPVVHSTLDATSLLYA